MGYYDVDFNVLGSQMLPVKLRQLVISAWVRCVLVPIVTIYTMYMASRTNNLYYLRHNGQIPYLEGVLNDTFDAVERRIYIGDGPYYDPLPLYLATEERPVYLALVSELPVSEYDAPVYLYTEGETTLLGFQFIVYYPTGLIFDEVRMRALIERYRIAGKNYYNIQSY